MRYFSLSLLLACGSGNEITNGDSGTDGGALQSGTWVWQSDVPASGQLNAVWGAATDDAWAVGDDGLALHWNGKSWSVVDPATTNHLHAIWGSSASDVWVAGGGLGGPNTANLVHWNGQAWSVVDPGTTMNLASVWGTSAKDVYAAGASGVAGTIQHFDGATWSTAWSSSEMALAAIAGSSTSDVWVVGAPIYPTFGDHYILHGQAQGFTPVASGVSQYLSSVWSADASHAWAYGLGGLLAWNGQSWSAVSTTLPLGQGGVWGLAKDAVWAVGGDQQIAFFDGSAWKTVHADAIGSGLTAVGGSDASHAWAVGENVVMRFDTTVTATATCADVRGQCGDASACGVGQGHASDYACSGGGGTVCCVAETACGGAELACCDGGNPGPRPLCHNGAFYCPGTSSPCPLHP